MGLKGHETRDIFPDFRTYIYPPVSAAWSDPKAWGIATNWSDITGMLWHPTATFITDGVQIGDRVYICSGDPTATHVANLPAEDRLQTVLAPPAPVPNPLYKVGHGPQHTIQSLASIVGARATTFYTLHHGKLWTGVQRPHWNTDETGDVYVISHDIQKARWLDGEIDLLIRFPGDPQRPPEPLHISEWDGRFPGEPRPDYPPGLEPGGEIREQLLDEHGTLLLAHEPKSKVEE